MSGLTLPSNPRSSDLDHEIPASTWRPSASSSSASSTTPISHLPRPSPTHLHLRPSASKQSRSDNDSRNLNVADQQAGIDPPLNTGAEAVSVSVTAPTAAAVPNEDTPPPPAAAAMPPRGRPMSKRLVRRKLLNGLPNLLAPLVFSAHVLLAPYTKVEESFTLHATHDFLAFGSEAYRDHKAMLKYDHVKFPGAVPRSFLPPNLLGALVWPIASLSVYLGWIRTKVGIQILVRLVLAFASAQVFNHLSRTLRQKYGSSVRWWFLVLSLSQFHIPFYAGRTLPNFLALPMVTLCISFILRSNSSAVPPSISLKRLRFGIIYLTATATVLRLELAAFLLPLVLTLILMRRMTLWNALVWGATGGLGSLNSAIYNDMTHWRPTLSHPDFPFTSKYQFIWPEATALWYNIFLGKSSDWGTSPWYHYILNALPRTCLSSLPLAGVAILWWMSGRMGIVKTMRGAVGVEEVVKTFGAGVVALVGGMSCIGHKEWRFIVYVVPIFNILAAFGASQLWQFPYGRLRPLARLGLVGLVCANVLVTALSTYVSMYNYPGGEVWRILEREAAIQEDLCKTISVHYTNYPLQTGASLFTFLHLPHSSRALPQPPPPPPDSPSGTEWDWIYSKSEDPALQTPMGAWEAGMDYVVLDDALLKDWVIQGGEDKWVVKGKIRGLGGWKRTGKWKVELETVDRVSVLRRKGGKNCVRV